MELRRPRPFGAEVVPLVCLLHLTFDQLVAHHWHSVRLRSIGLHHARKQPAILCLLVILHAQRIWLIRGFRPRKQQLLLVHCVMNAMRGSWLCLK